MKPTVTMHWWAYGRMFLFTYMVGLLLTLAGYSQLTVSLVCIAVSLLYPETVMTITKVPNDDKN